jgi:hypothetical protein
VSADCRVCHGEQAINDEGRWRSCAACSSPLRLTARGVYVLSLLSALAALVLGAKGIDWTGAKW